MKPPFSNPANVALLVALLLARLQEKGEPCFFRGMFDHPSSGELRCIWSSRWRPCDLVSFASEPPTLQRFAAEAISPDSTLSHRRCVQPFSSSPNSLELVCKPRWEKAAAAMQEVEETRVSCEFWLLKEWGYCDYCIYIYIYIHYL